MRKRIFELEDALENQPPTKRVRTSKLSDEPEAGPSASSSAVTSAAKAKADTKKVDIDEVVEAEDSEFHAIFDGKGILIQPTPTNKPTSTVTIKEYTAQDVEDLFGKHFKELKGNCYSVDGIMANFAKGQKIGLVALNFLGLSISYAQNTMKCSMKFEVTEATMYRSGLDEDFDEYEYYTGARSRY
ncbi:hypothetical protein EW145_g342 [Phellinidium pouzarii]|uniref:Uncharacterized protein n=1 Tax=Phellinidium pouzarii TaxID=167371 RepID=A0A4S4LIP0_9AGAM|nr:hypothetical protein EW145_g342 [Phellinidium pouzarii]